MSRAEVVSVWADEGSERDSGGEDQAVVVGVVGGGGDLHAGSQGEAEAAVEFPMAYQAGREEILDFSVVGASFVERGIEFEFREKCGPVWTWKAVFQAMGRPSFFVLATGRVTPAVD